MPMHLPECLSRRRPGVQNHPHHDAEHADQHHSGSVGIGGENDFGTNGFSPVIASAPMAQYVQPIFPTGWVSAMASRVRRPSITAKNAISTMLKMAETFSTRRPVIVLAKYTTKARVRVRRQIGRCFRVSGARKNIVFHKVARVRHPVREFVPLGNHHRGGEPQQRQGEKHRPCGGRKIRRVRVAGTFGQLQTLLLRLGWQ